MDFSTPVLALKSLQRRKPNLSNEILQVTSDTLNLIGNSNGVVSLECIPNCMIFLQENSKRWESLAVGLYLSNTVLEHVISLRQQEETTKKENSTIVESGVYMEGPRVPVLISSSTNTKDDCVVKDSDSSSLEDGNEVLIRFGKVLEEMMRIHLEHEEPRIRSLVARLVGSYARLGWNRMELYNGCLFPSLQSQLKLQRTNDGYSKSSTGALDDTTGWRAVETHLQAIASYIHGTGPSFFTEQQQQSSLSSLYQSCQHCCIDHVNRHVRAAGIQLLEQCILISPKDNIDDELNAVIIQVLKHTLADNWSQVRMAGSVLCRKFLLHTSTLGEDVTYWPILLPRMCLNRFYLAQGVKLYSLDTWKMVFDDGSGLEMVAKYAGAICRYYIQMCDADNHVVREGACQAVAELANKIGKHPKHSISLRPYISMLLQALLMCFHDESWPVRDEACLACGTFCLAYPVESEPELPILMERWGEHLTDQIWSVREDAAIALSDAIVAYGPSLFQTVMDTLLKPNIRAAKDQPSMTKEEYIQRQNDIQAHTDSQLYSCGSLAPKLKKGSSSSSRKDGAGRIGGCSSCLVNRPKQPWEATDGCIYLLRELVVSTSNNNNNLLLLTDDVLVPLVEELMDVCRVRHFPQSDDLRATLWKCWPVMAHALGKQRFKRTYLHLLLELLFQTLDNNNNNNTNNNNALCYHAASQCCEELANFVGISIFRGRLEEPWQQQLFDRILQERNEQLKQQPQYGSMNDTFSPFGPPPFQPQQPIMYNQPPLKTTTSTSVSSIIMPSSVPGNSFVETL